MHHDAKWAVNLNALRQKRMVKAVKCVTNSSEEPAPNHFLQGLSVKELRPWDL